MKKVRNGGVIGDPHAPIVLAGASDQAEVLLDLLERIGEARRVAAIVDASDAGSFLGRRVGTHRVESTLSELCQADFEGALVLPAVGETAARTAILRAAALLGLELATVVDRSAVVATEVTLGRGVVVAAGAIVGPHTTVGDGTIVNVGAVIAHHGSIGRVCHLGPGSVLAGNVALGAGSTVGAGAAVRDDVRIGSGVTVGLAAAVVDDVESGLTVVGVPARPL